MEVKIIGFMESGKMFIIVKAKNIHLQKKLYNHLKHKLKILNLTNQKEA